MKKLQQQQAFRLTALAAALAALPAASWAQDAEVDELIKPSSSVSAGIGAWSDDRHQQGIYDGMRDGKAYGLLDLDLVKRDDATGTWMTLNGRNLGLDTRELKGEWLRQGDIGVSLEYGRLVRDNPFTVTTGLYGLGTTSQVISGAGTSALPKGDVDLGTTRDIAQLGFSKNFGPRTDLKISFRNDDKTGTRHWGMGSNPYFVVEPIDSTTRSLDVVMNYSGEKLQLSGGYNGSWYDNANSLVWARINGAATPGTTSAANPTPLTLPLDNQAHQFFLNGGYSLTPKTRATFKLSYGKATQDEQLPTYGLAAPNNRFLGAPSHLNGRIDTTLAEVGITSHAVPKLALLANLRYHDVNDKTPVAAFVGDNTTLAPSVYNTPHSIRTTSGKVEGTYRLPGALSLMGGIEYKDQDRSAPNVGTLYVPFRRGLEETTYKLRLRRSMAENVNGSIAYMHSKRDGSSYTETGDHAEDAINPMHIADRKRDKWRGAVDWTPSDQLSFQFAIEDAKDTYGPDEQPQGLKDGKARLYSVDATYTINKKWQVTGWISRDETQAREWGSRFTNRAPFAALAQKDADLSEVGDSLGIGLRGEVSSALRVGGNLEWARSVTKHRQDLSPLEPGDIYPVSAGITVRPLEDITNRLTRLKLFAEYTLRKNSELRFDLIHERWQTDDWTWQFSDGSPFVYGTTIDGTRITASPKQNATFAGIRYIHKFR